MKQQADFSRKFISANNTTYKTVTKNTKEYLNSLKSASNSLGSMIDRLQKDLGGATYTEGQFFETLAKAKDAFAKKQYGEYAKYVQSLSRYVDFLDKKQYASAAEKRYEKAVVLNELRSLKSPTDLMLEQLSQINSNTASSASNTNAMQEKLYKLTEVQLGGLEFEEIVANGIVQGIKTDNLAMVIGQNSEQVTAQLEGMNAYWQKVPLKNGKWEILADFDQDGIYDLAAGIDASGRITSIDTDMANTYKTIEQSFGDVKLSEVFSQDTLTSLYGDNWHIALGDTLKSTKNIIEQLGGKIEKLSDKDFLVDIDQDGVWDFNLVFDKTGHLQKIDENTANIGKNLAQELKRAIAKVNPKWAEKIDPSSDWYAKHPLATKISTQMYQAIGDYITYITSAKGNNLHNKNWWKSAYQKAKAAKEAARKLVELGYGNYGTGLKGEKYHNTESLANSDILEIIKRKAKKYGIELYATGGYTGDGGKYDFAGLVHRGEYVLPQEMESIFPLMETMRTGGRVELHIGLNEVVRELRALRAENEKLREELTQVRRHTRDTAENTKPLAKDDIWESRGIA